MDKVNDYIMVINSIPKELCESLIDECNKKQWKKHTWNNYAEGTFESMPTKELDVMPCTQEQQNKITPYLIKALEEYQNKYSKPGEKTSPLWLTKFSPIRFNKYPIGTMMREHYDHIHSLFDGSWSISEPSSEIRTAAGLENEGGLQGGYKDTGGTTRADIFAQPALTFSGCKA